MKLASIRSLIAASLTFATLASADITIFYPSEEKAVFTIQAPEGWEFEAGTQEDPYCTLSKDDTVLWFRTVEGNEDALDEAIEETYEYVKETYPKATLPTPEKTKIDGKVAVAAAGNGKDTEGTPTQFGFAWVFIGEDKIAELWFEVPDTDKGLLEEAAEILKSFKAK
jgi:hypothetical protein